MRGFKRLKQEQARQQEQTHRHHEDPPPYLGAATVHYGRWHMPNGEVQMTRLVTLPRSEQDRWYAEKDPVRSSWPSR
jgi:hypothetical protein